MDLIERFAVALDADDYQTVASLLADDVEYFTGDKTIVGRDAVVESFRSASRWGRTAFDELTFLHEIAPDKPLDIRFIDILVKKGERFTLDHTMHVGISVTGLIERLDLTYPSGERERLAAFLARHSIS